MNLLTGAFAAPEFPLPELSASTKQTGRDILYLEFLHQQAVYCGGKSQGYFNSSNNTVTVLCGDITNAREIKVRAGCGENCNLACAVGMLLSQNRAEEILPLLDGGFCIAFCDFNSGEWLLCRDRCGQQRLHWALESEGQLLRFAESPADFAPCSREISPIALQSYLLLGTIPAPFSIYHNVHKLPAASVLRGKLGSDAVSLSRWWQPDFSGLEPHTPDECADELLPLLKNAVEESLNAADKTGLLLSGGIDSGIIAAVAGRYFPDAELTAVTMCSGERDDESKLAAATAAHLNLPLKTFSLPEDILPLLEAPLKYAGEPFGNSSLLAVSAALSNLDCTNILMGDGGDELFGGYRRYQAMLKRHSLPQWMLTALRPLFKCASALSRDGSACGRICRSLALPPLSAYCSFLEITTPETTAKILETSQSDFSWETMWQQELSASGLTGAMQYNYLDYLHYLPEDGCRKLEYAAAGKYRIHTPMLSNQIAAFSASLPRTIRFNSQERKLVLRRLAERMLPPEILAAPKKGFGVPIGKMLRNAPQKLLAELPERLENGLLKGIFNQKNIRQMITEHINEIKEHGQLLWALMALERWNSTQS